MPFHIINIRNLLRVILQCSQDKDEDKGDYRNVSVFFIRPPHKALVTLSH